MNLLNDMSAHVRHDSWVIKFRSRGFHFRVKYAGLSRRDENVLHRFNESHSSANFQTALVSLFGPRGAESGTDLVGRHVQFTETTTGTGVVALDGCARWDVRSSGTGEEGAGVPITCAPRGK